MSAHSSALCSLIFCKQLLLVRHRANKRFFVEIPKFALCSIVCINYCIYISNLLQWCSSSSVAGDMYPIGLLTKMWNKENMTFFALYF